MAILASFIGIDKHLDLDIRDLTGARRDAMALWALFSDTLPDINAQRLLDEEATHESVSKTLKEILGNAEPDDTVIISFAGHGTRDHRLVVHDSVATDLANTTVPMAELATLFKQSKAKAILFILDCCFSGGAPARVLENSPLQRTPENPLRDFEGEGRILIAASHIDEPALEHPTARHGLLTKALIDVLQMGQGNISLPTAMDEVSSRVRAEASRMGMQQTPVCFCYTEGGLVLPVLQRGKRFNEAFPEMRGARISHSIDEIAAFGIPSEILAAWSKQFPGGLNGLQLEAVNECRVLDGESLLVVAPTSSGKTFIGEMAAARAIAEGRKAVFLFPYRALTSEKYDQFLSLYGDTLGMRVVRCTGDYVDQTSLFVGGKYDLALLTFEMFLNLAVGSPWVLNQIGLVVVDEAQFVSDPSRGIVVELLLTHLLAAREKGINPQIIALSAVIGGINDFDSWLGCRKLVTFERPVPLVEGVLDRSGVFQCQDASGKEQRVQLLPPGAIRQRKDKPSAQDVIVPLVQKLIRENPKEKVIIFRNQRGTAQGAAKYLAQDLGLQPAGEIIARLPDRDLSTTSADLRACLGGGTAFHSTNLTREEKAVIEQAFRDPESPVRVLGATTTVAAGVNTPASTVIIAEQEFKGEDGRDYTVAEYKNMAGRAGRVGYQEEGKAIILAETTFQREQLFERYVKGDLGLLKSSFDPGHIETWIIRLLAQVERVPEEEVVRLLASTFGGFLFAKRNPKWQSETKQHLADLMERMIGLGLVERDGDFVRLTLLGRACGASSLSFASAMRLVELLREMQNGTLTAEHLMALLQVLPESDNGYTPMMKKGTRESVRPSEAGERYGPGIVRVLQRYARDQIDYYARCKRSAILWDWVQGVPIEQIEQRYSPNPPWSTIGYGDIRKFADSTRFHLRSAYQIAALMFVTGGPNAETMDALLKQLEMGLPAEALGLLTIPAPLSRGEYLALYRAGVKTVEELWALPEESLKGLLGEQQVRGLEKARPKGKTSEGNNTL